MQRYSIPWAGTAGIYLCFLVLVALALAPGFRSSSRSAALERPRPQRLVLFGCGCLLPYLLYALGTGDFRWLALLKLAVVAVVVIGVYAGARVRNPAALLWQDALVAVFLIAVVLSGWLKRIWSVPVNLDFMGRLFVIAIASWAWSWVRLLPALGYTAQQIDTTVRTLKLGAQTNTRWTKIQSELDQVSVAFGLGSIRTGENPEHTSSTTPSAASPASGPSCMQAVGADKSKQLVQDCLAVSPATHPPCNTQNSCALIIDEIKRGCGMLDARNAPAFCKEYK